MEMHPNAPAPIPAPDDQAQHEATVRVCLVTLCGELFAIDLGSVREVFELESVTPVPKMPPVFTGVTNVRGMIIPLVDLRPLLGFPVEFPGPRAGGSDAGDPHRHARGLAGLAGHGVAGRATVHHVLVAGREPCERGRGGAIAVGLREFVNDSTRSPACGSTCSQPEGGITCSGICHGSRT